MDNKLAIPPPQVPKLKEFYTNLIKEVDKKMQPFIEEKNGYLQFLSQLEDLSEAPHTLIDEYDTKWSYLDKAIFLISEASVELTMLEIANRIRGYEPEVRLADVTNNLSAIFSMDSKKEKPKLKRRKNDKNKYVYQVAD